MANYTTTRSRINIIISPSRKLAIYFHEVQKLGLEVVLGMLERADFYSEDLGVGLTHWFKTQEYLNKVSLENINCRRRLKRQREGEKKCQH